MARKTDQVCAQIIKIATHEFSKKGYDKASIKTIADRCDLTHVGVLYHFKTKQNLFVASVDVALKRLEEVIANNTSNTDGAAVRLLKHCRGYVDWRLFYKSEAELFALFAYFSSVDQEFTQKFSAFTLSEREKIENILLAGNRESDWDIQEVKLTARFIHDFIIGISINSMGGRLIITSNQEFDKIIKTVLQKFTGKKYD